MSNQQQKQGESQQQQPLTHAAPPAMPESQLQQFQPVSQYPASNLQSVAVDPSPVVGHHAAVQQVGYGAVQELQPLAQMAHGSATGANFDGVNPYHPRLQALRAKWENSPFFQGKWMHKHAPRGLRNWMLTVFDEVAIDQVILDLERFWFGAGHKCLVILLSVFVGIFGLIAICGLLSGIVGMLFVPAFVYTVFFGILLALFLAMRARVAEAKMHLEDYNRELKAIKRECFGSACQELVVPRFYKNCCDCSEWPL